MDDERSLGRYQLLHKIGEGGMGVVYLARAHGAAGFEKLVALKCLHRAYTGNAERTRGLLREALIGVQLDHDQIVGVYDLGEEQGTYFIAMEYVRGHSLAHVLRYYTREGGRLPVRAAVHIARKIADAIDYVHRFDGGQDGFSSLIHGDISPSNIILSVDGRIKLTDFGVAAIAQLQSESQRIAGKIAYLPPEALGGATREQAWDVYALTAMLLISLAGALEDHSAAKDIVRRMQRRQDTGELLGHVPGALRTLLERGLSVRSEGRFANARSFKRNLDRACPRSVDDEEFYRDFIQELFSRATLVAELGELPTTGGISGSMDLEPFLAETAMAEVGTRSHRRSSALRFGLSPAAGPERAREFGHGVAEVLSRLLQREVHPVVLGDYQALVECLCSGEIDVAWMPPAAFVSAWDRGAGLVAGIRRQGAKVYESVVFTLASGPYRQLHELRQQAMGWVARDSASGYLFAAASASEAVGPLDRFFSEQHFFGSHEALCRAVDNGWVAAGATYASRGADGIVMSAGYLEFGKERYRPLHFSGPIPADNIAHRPFLADTVLVSLRDALARFAEDEAGATLLREAFHGDGFYPLSTDDYESVRARLSKVSR